MQPSFYLRPGGRRDKVLVCIPRASAGGACRRTTRSNSSCAQLDEDAGRRHIPQGEVGADAGCDGLVLRSRGLSTTAADLCFKKCASNSGYCPCILLPESSAIEHIGRFDGFSSRSYRSPLLSIFWNLCVRQTNGTTHGRRTNQPGSRIFIFWSGNNGLPWWDLRRPVCIGRRRHRFQGLLSTLRNKE
jgi:hypothetical protein